MIVTIAQTDEQVRRCLPVILALRPQLSPEQAFTQIRFQQAEDRYRLAFIDSETDTDAPAAIGYRMMHLLHSGKTLYIDDLSTLPEGRGKGYASTLLDFVVEQARQAGCQSVSLDSGQNAARYTAHRLYLNKGFNITSHHFHLSLQ
jgi:GNAT superfamily N-acetyltransferase